MTLCDIAAAYSQVVAGGPQKDFRRDLHAEEKE
jgi:hypothetical protein